MDLVRLIPFKARIITGREYGQVDGWPEDDLYSGKEGMVVGCLGGSGNHFLICIPGQIPHWVEKKWLRVIERQDA